MRSRWLVRIAVLLITVLVSGRNDAKGWDGLRLDVISISTRQQFRGTLCHVMGWKQGSMASFTARQELRDEVCIAMSDGRMSRTERFEILSDAQALLSPEEFEGFKQALDRHAPAPAAVAKRSTNNSRMAKSKLLPASYTQPSPTLPKPLAEAAIIPDAAGEVFVSD